MNSEPPPENTKFLPTFSSPRIDKLPNVSWTDDKGKHNVIIEGPTLVGSAERSGIVVADPAISRLHAEFDPREDGLWVRDLGSKNGSHIEGVRVEVAHVPHGGKIRLGSTVFVVSYEDSAPHHDIWPEARFGPLLGWSHRMRELFAVLARIAPMPMSVLINGETGTGKELVARAIHDASKRASRPFVIVDCAAIPETLFDSELFGHSKGAFTGATTARVGAIEMGDGGTVFLDEVGELPRSVQPKLLRVLESRTVRRVGESEHRKVDVRFLSATHRDLRTMVNEGEFREDLYFRLAVVPIIIPPLRERPEDIDGLVDFFMSANPKGGSLTPEVRAELKTRPWRGNVRELRNFIERLVALGAGEALAMTPESAVNGRLDSSESIKPPPSIRTVSEQDAKIFDQTLKDFRMQWADVGEREYLKRILERNGGNVAGAAQTAGADRSYIYRLIRKHR